MNHYKFDAKTNPKPMNAFRIDASRKAPTAAELMAKLAAVSAAAAKTRTW